MSSWDPDIASLELSDVEKNGLQVFRNYQRSFRERAEKQLASEIDSQPVSLTDLTTVVGHISKEDLRAVPVVACAFADDRLRAVFEEVVPQKIIGGRSNIFGPFGPISGFYQRLQLAQMFNLISSDIVESLNVLRIERNKISHSWEIKEMNPALFDERFNADFPIETLKSEDVELAPEQLFRIHVIWMITRLHYESLYFNLAKAKGLPPTQFLYGENRPKALDVLSRIAFEPTQTIIDDCQ
jgi:hypothetical protein